MADSSPGRGRRIAGHVPSEPHSIAELIRAGTLDAELAATLWLLVEGHVPVIVAAADREAGAGFLLRALLDFMPAAVRRIELAGEDETFAWLPQASELGWDGRFEPPAEGDAGPVRPDTTLLVVAELSDAAPSSTWGPAARLAIRAATIGYGLAATIPADGLDEVLEALGSPSVGASDDGLSRLGVVLVLRRVDDAGPRVVAAHYLRPTARDEHGHVQRLGPAVLATWDAVHDRFEHFGWGITPELAIRVGRRAGDFELEVGRRRTLLAGLATGIPVEPDDIRTAIDAYRPLATAPRSDAVMH